MDKKLKQYSLKKEIDRWVETIEYDDGSIDTNEYFTQIEALESGYKIFKEATASK